MKLLRIKDNSQQKKDAFSQVARLTGKIADKTLEQLEREGVFVFPETVKDAEDITQDQMILQSVNDTYRSGNVMGFLGYGDERLVIASRFCGEGEDYFFQYLLDKVLDFPNIVDLDADANQDNRLFNFLLFLFPYYLKAAMRKGLFKNHCRGAKRLDGRKQMRAARISSMVDERLTGYTVMIVRKVRLCGKTNSIHAMRMPHTPSIVSSAGASEIPKPRR